MDKILLIDLHNQIYRAYAGFGFGKKQTHIQCSGGFDEACNHTSHEDHCICGQKWIENESRCFSQANEDYVLIFNFFRNLRPLIELFSPDKCFVIGEGHPTFRYDLYPEYKANRIIKTASKQETKDKFTKSKDEIVRLLQLMPITYAVADQYEADDVIGTLAENMSEEDITILSGDSDFIQLLQRGYKHCSIYNPIKKEFAVAPTYSYIAWKCMNGDTSDNISKILSPKKALGCATDPELFKKFMSVEENRANFAINRKLIEFANVPLEEIIFVEGENNFIKLEKEFDKMNFNSITNEKSWKKYTDTFKCIKF